MGNGKKMDDLVQRIADWQANGWPAPMLTAILLEIVEEMWQTRAAVEEMLGSRDGERAARRNEATRRLALRRIKAACTELVSLGVLTKDQNGYEYVVTPRGSSVIVGVAPETPIEPEDELDLSETDRRP